MSLSLANQGVGWAVANGAIQSYVQNAGQLPESIDLSRNNIGLEGLECLCSDWLVGTTVDTVSINGRIRSLNLAVCSIGRFTDENTGAFVYSPRAMTTLGRSAINLVSLDLSWNDLNSDGLMYFTAHFKIKVDLTSLKIGVRELVRGLLGIEDPTIDDVDAINMRTLSRPRIALREINLKGNSIGDEGATWLALLLGREQELSSLNLVQCAIGAEGAIKIRLALEEGAAVEVLDLTENDLASQSVGALHLKCYHLSALALTSSRPFHTWRVSRAGSHSRAEPAHALLERYRDQQRARAPGQRRRAVGVGLDP